MPKISVEIEVGENYCDENHCCPFFNRDVFGDVFCSLYPHSEIVLSTNAMAYERCDECRRMEIIEE